MARLRQVLRIVCVVAAGLGPAATVGAQPLGFSLGVPDAPTIRTIDQDRLYFESLFGQRVQDDIMTASRALEDENQRLVNDLSARERELTEQRAELSPEEFRDLADAFNAEAEAIRDRQESKSREIARFQEAEQLRFFETAGPLLNDLVVDLGASLLVDSRFVLIATDDVDLTDDAITRIDEALGDGSDARAHALPRTDPTQAPAQREDPDTDMTPPLELPGPEQQP